MGDQIAIQPGFPAWEPAEDAELVKSYNFYDMPLVGLVRQEGTTHVFWCVEGHGASENLWAYAVVHPDEASRLDAAAGESEAFERTLEEITINKPVVVALAREGHGVVSSALVEDRDPQASLLDEAIKIFRSIDGGLEKLRTAERS